MHAGFGLSDITPPLGVELAGYGYYLERRAEGVLDPLYVRAIALETDTARCMIICCDLLGLSTAVADAVRCGLARFGYKPNQVMLVSIHTHTGPAVQHHEGCGEVSEEYVASLPARILCACELAVSDLASVAKLERREGFLPREFAYNRADAEESVENIVRGILIERRDRPPVALVSYACHPVTRRRIPAVSADFPGRLTALLDQDGYRAVYLNGLCGDIDPVRSADRDELLESFAQGIREAFVHPIRREELPLDTLSAARMEFDLRLITLTESEIAAKAQGAANARVASKWVELMTANPPVDSEAAPVNFINLGGVPIVGLPFEGFERIGRIVRERVPSAWTLGCSGQMLGYLPTKSHYERESYAVWESSFLYKRMPAQPGEAERLGGWIADRLDSM
ncbi:hypothetical protein AGMMS49992_24600 [Clostridia bacterium]|nr:hypothetical protein AGMMS49992_24600 [Clostridia bacterium]